MTRAPHAFSSRSLPVELMTLVLDNADLPLLLRLSHSCRRWRAVARAHPQFWRDIRLASLSTTALDFFHARLDQATASDIRLEIKLPNALEHGRIRSVVLPAVAGNLHRVVELRIMLHYDTASYALASLTGTASRLRNCALGFFHGAEKPPVLLPVDVLSGHCPTLGALTLKNVAFPKDTIRSFSHVHHLLFGCDGPYMFPLGLFQHFPALRILSVHGETCLGAEPSGEPEGEVTLPQLDTFAVHISQCDHLALFSAVPHLSSIPTVKCHEPNDEIMRNLLDHLHGPLELELAVPRVWEDQIEVGYSTPNADRSRIFVGEAESIQAEWPRDIAFAPELAERVTALRCAASLAYLVPLFGELPACTTLALEVADVADLTAQPEFTLALPALKSIVLRSRLERGPIQISAAALHDFLVRVVGVRADKPTLRIDKSLTLIGDDASLKQDYRLCSAGYRES